MGISLQVRLVYLHGLGHMCSCNAVCAPSSCIHFDMYWVVLSRFESPAGLLKPVLLPTFQTAVYT